MEQLLRNVWDKIEDQVIETIAAVAVELITAGAQLAIREIQTHTAPPAHDTPAA